MLVTLPCLDSDEMASARQRELNMPHRDAARLGRTAVEAMERGTYRSTTGRTVNWRDLVHAARAEKVSISPTDQLERGPDGKYPSTRVQVANETTLGAAERLDRQGLRPLALNFANGIRPGGGFLRGALAQEEALCRSSALYATLVDDPMYAAHRKRPRPDSTDWAIYSPDVPVFRNDAGAELEKPWLLCFITCAAPVAVEIGHPESGDLLQVRIRRILEIARSYGHGTLVLGAWGCGAFGNDPLRTARDFRTALEGEFDGAFAEVVFAVTDWSPQRRFLGPFRDVFGTS